MTTIRKTLKNKRKNLSLEQQVTLSKKITQQVIHSAEFQHAQHIACYLSMLGEVHTQEIIEAIWHAKKSCYLPIVTEQALQFALFTPDTELTMCAFGFSHPINITETIVVDKLDVVITPLVGFDKNCNRLGMGAGHYDRSFAFLNIPQRPTTPIMLGIAYDFQQMDALEKQPWDVTLDKVITETQIFYKNKSL